MQLRFFGGLAVEDDEGARSVPGRGQQALLLRLALDAGTTVGYRALSEDIWPSDAPEDPRASLQSLASRLRRSLPAGALEAAPGGYRLSVAREDVDVVRFQDLVARARSAPDDASRSALAREALALWTGDPWVPSDGFDWVVRDLLEDRAHAQRLLTPAPLAPASAAGVPAALTSLVGRGTEIALIDEQLASERLVTILGPGGAGKTTLALDAARRHGGAVVVELAPAAAGDVWAAVAGAVGRSIRLTDGTNPPSDDRARALAALAGRRVLIVLDNCEHVSREAAVVALDLLRELPAARLLATSREPLGVPGEAFVDLGPLPLGDAAELFGRRMRAATGAAPAPSDADTVARIARRLDGLPLAVELAAAKTRTLSLWEIDEGLDDRFALLATGPRAGITRHQTLRALIDWSWETLGDAERTALLTAAVLPDGLAATDAATIGRHGGIDVVTFDALVDRSLLTRRAGRFRMLETVREYGLDRLRAIGREVEFRRAAAVALAELATERDAILRGPAVRDGLAWFDANDENLAAAIRFSADAKDRELGVRLVRGCLWAWLMRERFAELSGGVEAFAPADAFESEADVVVTGFGIMLASFAAAGTPPTADATTAEVTDDARGAVEREFLRRRDPLAAAAARYPSELSAAVPPLLDAAARAVKERDRTAPWSLGFELRVEDAEDAPPWTRALLSVLRAAIAQNSGDVDTLGRESKRALGMFRRIGDPWGVALSSQMRSEWLTLEGRLEEALAAADTSGEELIGLTSIGDLLQQRSQTVGILLRLGRIDEARRRLATIDTLAAADGSGRAIAQARMCTATVEIAVGDGAAALRAMAGLQYELGTGMPDQLVAWAFSKRAQALLLENRPADAREALREAVPIAVQTGDQPIIADVAVSLAAWLVATGRGGAARTALDVAAELRGRSDETDPVLRRVRAQLAADARTDGSSGAGLDLAALTAMLDEGEAGGDGAIAGVREP